MKTLLFCILILALISILTSCQTQQKDLLGKWEFVKFCYDDTAHIDSSDLPRADSVNAGLSITFSSDDSFETNQPHGLIVNNSKGTYQVLLGNRLYLGRETLRIIEANDTFLKLYRDANSPMTLFQKQN